MPLPSTLRARPNMQMRCLRLTFVLPLAFTLASLQLHAQDAVDGLLRRGPGPRGQQSQQSGLPPTQPTTAPTPVPAQPPSQPNTPSAPKNLNERPATRARVIFANGLLEVRADNSGLLQILHDVSRVTGMSITGGVIDERVFGDYGPASPATVLATLLDGTGANMLLRQDPVSGAPIQLVLTQRSGGSAPSPNDAGFDDSPFPPEGSAPVRATPAPPSSSNPVTPDPNAPHPTNYVPGSPFNPQQPVPAQSTANPAPSATAPAASQPLGDSATPEAIYEQLLQMQKAKAPAAPSATPPPATPK